MAQTGKARREPTGLIEPMNQKSAVRARASSDPAVQRVGADAASLKAQASQAGRLSKPRKPRLTRQEKSERTRAAICQAAAEIIGEYGYANASISRIMERAGLGHGTFYAYFDSRQDLFDALLPMKGEEVLDVIQSRVRGAPDIVEMEHRGLLAFFAYAQEHPWFFRLLHEAHVAAPDGHRRHIGNILARYRKALGRSYAAGELSGYDESELDTLALLLMSARDYIYSQHVARSSDPSGAIRDAAKTYAKFVAYGLRGAPESASPPDEGPANNTADEKAGAPPPDIRA